MKNVGNSSRGRSQGVPKIFRTPMYTAHCTVIFAIAQLSCFMFYCMFYFTCDRSYSGPALGMFEVFGRTGPQNLGGGGRRNFGH